MKTTFINKLTLILFILVVFGYALLPTVINIIKFYWPGVIAVGFVAFYWWINDWDDEDKKEDK